MAYRKRTAEEIQETKEMEVETNEEAVEEFVGRPVVKEQVKEQPKKEREYKPTDLVKCRSVVQGSLLFRGSKSNTDYRWDAANDVVEVEYQDLRAARISKHVFLMRGYFIIEDDELINQDEWAEVKKKYGELYSRKDLTSIFKLDVHEMAKAIKGLPDGPKSQMGSIAKALMDNGQLDSIGKIKAIDKILGTDLMLFISEGGGNVVL